MLTIGTILGYGPSTGFIQLYVVSLIFVPAMITLWLFIFNSGSSKVEEYAIEFSDDGLHYEHMAERDTVKWSEYKSYKVSGIISKVLTIQAESQKIIIDLMRFNAEHRKSIISELNKRC